MAATWNYLKDVIQPTVALVQEAHAFPMTPGGLVSSHADDVGYGTGVLGFEGHLEPLPEVFTRYSKRHGFLVEPRVPATFAAARNN